jgi:hypothetical protein
VDVTRLLDEPLRLLGVGDVRLDRAAAGLGCDFLRLLARRSVAEDQRRSSARKLERDSPADPA